LAIDKVRGGFLIFGTVRDGFTIRGEQGGVEGVVDFPGWWEFEAICGV
jgi:hypothetical protein